MAGKSRYSDEDKARIMATYLANGSNLKRTARECSVSVSTLRHWVKNAPPPVEQLQAALDSFVEQAERIRGSALDQLEAAVATGEVKARELITVIGVLDDKITRASGLPTHRTEQQLALPPREELAELFSGFVAGAIDKAERRHAEIVEADIVEDAEYRELTPGR